mmetsp:Transcript_50321/g.145948  ORF Transcript_50321/g.145948 Transcript_50321/m.145948 type:complete len:209 (-) Transcript_50321:459-1085(-)
MLPPLPWQKCTSSKERTKGKEPIPNEDHSRWIEHGHPEVPASVADAKDRQECEDPRHLHRPCSRCQREDGHPPSEQAGQVPIVAYAVDEHQDSTHRPLCQCDGNHDVGQQGQQDCKRSTKPDRIDSAAVGTGIEYTRCKSEGWYDKRIAPRMKFLTQGIIVVQGISQMPPDHNERGHEADHVAIQQWITPALERDALGHSIDFRWCVR